MATEDTDIAAVKKISKPRLKKIIPIETENNIKDHAAKLADQATDKARDAAKQGLGKASDVLNDVADTVKETADAIESRFGKTYGDYARKAAEAVVGAASAVKKSDIDKMVESARTVVKKNPMAALGAAAVAGFALIRLLRAGDEDKHG